MNQTDKHCLKKIIIFDNRTNTNQLTQTAKDNYNLITTKTYGDLLQKLSHIDISGAVIGLEHFLSENDNQNKNLTKYTNHRFPIIFISTDNSLNTHLKALKLGGEGFYNYPIKPSIFDRINDANCNNNSSCNALFICNKNNKWDEIISQMPTENFNIDFTSEKNAIDKISKNKPDVVITDMALENCSGLEMATIIRSFFDFTVNTPFIFLCEDSKLYSELECSNISNNKFITKPVSAERLVSALSRIIKRNLISNKYSPLLQRHDSITGLYDREYFLAEIEKAHATVKKDHSRKIDLVYILFQKTNSDSESKFSDEFMFKELASAAILKARDKDIYARYSDSVFCAIVHNRNNKELGEDIRLLLKEIKTKISKSDKYKIKDIIISVGISTFSPKLENEIETLSQAEIAANSVAESGGNGIKFYTAKKEQKKNIARRKRWQQKIADGQFRIVYQPIVGLYENDRHQYEVLFRMKKRETLPEQFLHIADKINIIERIDIEICRRALDIAKRKNESGTDIELIANISQKTVLSGKLQNWLLKKHEQNNIPDKILAFAINQDDISPEKQKYLDFAKAISSAKQSIILKQSGNHNINSTFKTALDINASFIKLDRLFIHELNKDIEIQEKLNQLVSLCEKKGIKIIGGYVDDANTLASLWQAQVSYVQGYFIQKPVNSMTYHNENNAIFG